MRHIAATCLLLAAGALSAQNPSSGIRLASDYGQWTIPQGTSPTLGAIAWTAPSECQPTSVTGITLNPLRVGRQIRIIDALPGYSETVTIQSAVVNGTNCTINAPMQYMHTSYRIVSGTGGLQEAIDDGLTAGTSLVELTPAWVGLGGSTAAITGALGTTAVSILDARSSSLTPYAWNGSHYVASSFGGGIGSNLTGDCTYNTTTFVITCTKSNGTAFGSMAFQNANAVAITGGTVGSGQSPVSQVYANTISSVSGITNYVNSLANFGNQTINATNGIATPTNNYQPGPYVLQGAYWNGSSNALDNWSMSSSLGPGTNPFSNLVFQHSGAPGGSSVQFPSISTGQASAVGATCTVGGYFTLTIDGVSRKIPYCN